MICQKCRAELPEGMNFCPHCGEALTAPNGGFGLNGSYDPRFYAPYGQPYGYYQAPYAQSPYAQPPQAPYVPYCAQYPYYGIPDPRIPLPGNGLGIASLVLGIIGILVFLFGEAELIICSVIGLILGIIAENKASRLRRKNGFAIAGIICSIVPVSIIMMLLFTGVIALILMFLVLLAGA